MQFQKGVACAPCRRAGERTKRRRPARAWMAVLCSNWEYAARWYAGQGPGPIRAPLTNPGTRHDTLSAGIYQRRTELGLPRREPSRRPRMLDFVTNTVDAEPLTAAPTQSTYSYSQSRSATRWRPAPFLACTVVYATQTVARAEIVKL